MEALLKTNEVCELVGISRQHLTRLVKKRLFPKPVYISVRSPRWQQKDIDKYIEDKK